MAPPPAASLPLQQRVLQLAQTLQFAWFVGHVTLLLCATRYSLSYITFNYASKWARFSYRTAFVAAAVTYGIVVFKSFRARARSGKTQQSNAVAIAGDENVQYLGKLSSATREAVRVLTVSQSWHSSGSSPARLPLPFSPLLSTLSSTLQPTPAQTSCQLSSLSHRLLRQLQARSPSSQLSQMP